MVTWAHGKHHATLTDAGPIRTLQVGHKEISLTVTSLEPAPGFLTLNPAQRVVLKTTFRPVQVQIDGAVRTISLVQVRSRWLFVGSRLQVLCTTA
jgi:hypothetical protein